MQKMAENKNKAGQSGDSRHGFTAGDEQASSKAKKETQTTTLQERGTIGWIPFDLAKSSVPQRDLTFKALLMTTPL